MQRAADGVPPTGCPGDRDAAETCGVASRHKQPPMPTATATATSTPTARLPPQSPTCHTDDYANADADLHADGHAHVNAAAAAESHARNAGW